MFETNAFEQLLFLKVWMEEGVPVRIQNITLKHKMIFQFIPQFGKQILPGILILPI